MKRLNFEVKRNIRKPPRIYVKSTKTAVVYGSFPGDKPDEFLGWGKLDQGETVELAHYIANLNAVKEFLGSNFLGEQADYRLRLPISFASGIDRISQLSREQDILCDIFTPVLSTIIQELKIVTGNIKGEAKNEALTILEKFGLAEYKKIDRSQTVKAIFSELLSIRDKSEKLHTYAKQLFGKDKSFSPVAIHNMATGEIVPTKWLVSCAIAVILDERKSILCKIMTNNEIFVLFAKQLLDNNRKNELMEVVVKHELSFLTEHIKNYSTK